MKNGQCNFFGAYAKIYSLSDVTGRVFYVGCTVQSLELRLAGHLSEARSGSSNQKKNDFIKELDYSIVAKILEIKWVTGSKPQTAIKKARSIEQKWIRHYLDLGNDLANRDTCKTKIIKPKATPEFVGQTFTVKPLGKYTSVILEEATS